MHLLFLHRYFDRNAWTHDVLIALLTLKPEWTVGDLSEAFCNVCHHLEGPRASAAYRFEWMNHLNRAGRVNLKKADSGKSEEMLVRASLMPKAKVSLLRAAKWSMAKTKIEHELRDARKRLFAIIDDESKTLGEKDAALTELKRIRKSCERRLKAHQKRYRLAPPLS